MRIRCIASIILTLLLGACVSGFNTERSPKVTVLRVFVTATPRPTALPSQTGSPTPTAVPTGTPTLTLTPTPTAPAIVVVGYPRTYTLSDPVSQSGAPCGWVDTLDFPLNPPDGRNAWGGGDFGTYRSRYEKYHAGEDWGLSNRNNFGAPVYSIGHGQVTYAQSLGWGPDKGVVIIRHSFVDGQSLLSFYGHLDPDSVTLREGTCVSRGEIVGQIGRPRTPPHLHFEIRTQMPYSPGGGYWSYEPTTAGWLPPSQTISQVRLQTAPGVLWTVPPEDSRPLGELDADTYLMIREDHLLGIDLQTGRENWSIRLGTHIKDALLDADRGLLYVLDSTAGLSCYATTSMGDGNERSDAIDPLWVQDLSSLGIMELMPLPGGGVLVSHRKSLIALSPQGDLHWEADSDAYLQNWAFDAHSLLLITSDQEKPLMSADQEGRYVWDTDLSGIPLVAAGQGWLYAEDGLYKLDLVDRRVVKRVYDLPTALMRLSTAIPLSDGGLVLLHTDTNDRRLLIFDSTGALNWQFSISQNGTAQLYELDGGLYLLTHPSYAGRGSYESAQIFALDLEREQLLRLFDSGSRAFGLRSTWAVPVNNQKLFIQISGAGAAFFDPKAAEGHMGR